MSAVWLAVKRNETLRCCHLPIFQWNVPWKLLQTLLSNWSNLLGMMGKKQVGDVLRVWNDVFKFGPFCRGASHRRRAAIQTGLLHTLERWTSADTLQRLHTQSCSKEICNLKMCPEWALWTVELSTSLYVFSTVWSLSSSRLAVPWRRRGMEGGKDVVHRHKHSVGVRAKGDRLYFSNLF